MNSNQFAWSDPERKIEGYTSILDLPKLVETMDEVGFKGSDTEAYFGGNLLRIIKQSLVPANFTSISVKPTFYDFLGVKVKKSKTATFVVTNSSRANLTISMLTKGPDASMFKISGGGSKTIQPGKKLTIKVAFKPTSIGPKSATMEITTSDVVTPLVDIPLNGTGQ